MAKILFVCIHHSNLDTVITTNLCINTWNAVVTPIERMHVSDIMDKWINIGYSTWYIHSTHIDRSIRSQKIYSLSNQSYTYIDTHITVLCVLNRALSIDGIF
jgi:hypothetical protein